MKLKDKILIGVATPFALVGAMAIAGLVLISAEGPSTTASAPTTQRTVQPDVAPAPTLSLRDRAVKIKDGMSLSEVQRIMGSSGSREVTSSSGGLNMVTYTWGSIFGTYVQVMFINGQVANVLTM